MGRLKGAAVVAALVVAIAASAQGNVVTGANVKITFRGWLTPRTLPRASTAPVTLHLRAALDSTNGLDPPELERVLVEVNQHARVDMRGLPICHLGELEATSSIQALTVCRKALIGYGTFRAHIRIPDQAPFPAVGRLLAFSSKLDGRRTILAHVFGRNPVPTGQVLAMTFVRSPEPGTFGTALEMDVPELVAGWGRVKAFTLTLHRRFLYHGRWRSLISASCPAPSGFESALFPAARGTYTLNDGRVITKLVNGRCHVDPFASAPAAR
ncbi:MAG TPA: hypothetical protein VGF04_01355 [Solirubrobacterales bacterium]|jgi:hypothetical protein